MHFLPVIGAGGLTTPGQKNQAQVHELAYRLEISFSRRD
jgi:hypothetical protein